MLRSTAFRTASISLDSESVTGKNKTASKRAKTGQRTVNIWGIYEVSPEPMPGP